MGAQRFLFERFETDAGGFDLRAAVAAQIRRLLESNPSGEPEEEPELFSFGFPSVADFGFATPTERAVYAARLQALLERFEPRLLRPKVSLVERDGNPGIVIEARLASDDGMEPIRFRLGAEGLVTERAHG